MFQGLLEDIDPANPSPQDFDNGEMFLCREYNSIKDTLDEVRVTTLLSCDKPEDNPPTSNATKYHLCRSFCQAAKWVNACKQMHSELPSPVSSGGFREEDGHLIPVMVTTDPMPEMLVEIITCNCPSSCESGRCKCRKAKMNCTLLCHKKLKYNHKNCMNMNTE